MAKNIMQFRYYGDNSPEGKNQPSDISSTTLQSGAVFEPYLPIVQLGIQSLPGTQFYVNGDESIPPIVIGSTGIYELDLDGLSEITKLSFSKDSLKRINESEAAYLIVDIIYTSNSQEVS